MIDSLLEMRKVTGLIVLKYISVLFIMYLWYLFILEVCLIPLCVTGCPWEWCWDCADCSWLLHFPFLSSVNLLFLHPLSTVMVAIIHCLFLLYQSNLWKWSLKLGQPGIHITLAQWCIESKGVVGFFYIVFRGPEELIHWIRYQCDLMTGTVALQAPRAPTITLYLPRCYSSFMCHVTLLSVTLLYNAPILSFVTFVSVDVQLNLTCEKWYRVRTCMVFCGQRRGLSKIIVSL